MGCPSTENVKDGAGLLTRLHYSCYEMEVVALIRIRASSVDLLLKTLVLGSEMFIELVKVWVMITGTLRWDIMIFFWLLSVNLVVPLLTAWSLWLISVLHAPQKLCDSAAAMLGSIFLVAGCCGNVRHSALEGCFYEHWPIYQTKESKQWNGREGECNLWGALCNSSGLPSVLQRGLLLSHALQLGFWSVIIKEIKIWKWMWNILLHYILIWSLRRTSAVRCTGKMVVQPVTGFHEWERIIFLLGWKSVSQSGRVGVLLSSSLGRNCGSVQSLKLSALLCVSQRPVTCVIWFAGPKKLWFLQLFSEESVHINIHDVCLQTASDFFWE